MTNLYRITVREISTVEYSVDADSKEEARDLIEMGNQRVVTDFIVDSDILEIKEHKHASNQPDLH
jgi:hypothetical protein|tara:strand:+ start:2076 stop:2270 length:195 start_codon:yes stop_codon:yes gene_type:complete